MGYGDILSPTSALVYLTSTDEYPELTAEVDAAAKRKGNVRMQVSGGFLYEIEDEGTVRLSAMIRLDLRMKFLPPYLMDFVMKHFASAFVSHYNRQAGRFGAGGKLHHYIDEHADLYAELNRRLQVLESGPKPTS